jgi:antitoxin (DNA-binding transcriptional repressor) of toxin-antitoxin stability system
MNRVKIREARSQLSAIVNRAQQGESTVILRRGRAVATVEPVAKGKRGRLPDLSGFRASIKVKGRPLSKVVATLRKESRY